MLTPSSASALLLPCIIGDDRGDSAPDTWDVVLFDGDPRVNGAELAATGGYERASIANTDAKWAIDGGVAYSDPTSFAESTAAWPVDATYLALVDPAHPTVFVAVQETSEAISVGAAGISPKVRIRVLFADIGDNL